MDLETKNDYIQTDVWGLKDAEAVSGYNRVKNKKTRKSCQSHSAALHRCVVFSNTSCVQVWSSWSGRLSVTIGYTAVTPRRCAGRRPRSTRRRWGPAEPGREAGRLGARRRGSRWQGCWRCWPKPEGHFRWPRLPRLSPGRCRFPDTRRSHRKPGGRGHNTVFTDPIWGLM